MSKETLQKEKKPEASLDSLGLVIEGKSYSWHQQYITGAEVKKLAGLPEDSDLYLSVPDPWDDEPISNESKIDLARPEIEYFFIKRKLKFTINGKPFEWDRQYIMGQQIRKLGEIAEEDEIFLQLKEPYKDESIADQTKVDLARPGVEHFYSKEVSIEIVIIVNGTPKEWQKKQITFVEVIMLAYGTYIDKPTMIYTVAYEDGPKQNPEGSMVKGQTVFVKNKMIFHATATDKS
jgi:hypothetical protein